MVPRNPGISMLVVGLLLLAPVDAEGQILGVASPDSVDGRPRYSVSIGGWMKLHGVLDLTGTPYPSALSPPSIPVGEVERDPQFSMDMYQSRIQLDSRYIPSDFPELRAYVEMDFFGGGGGSLRLRHLFLDIGNDGPGASALVGQNWSVFSNPEAWPNMTDFDGPPTGLWKRPAQLRFQWEGEGGHRFRVSMETPTSDFGRGEESDTLVLATNQNIPEIAASYRKTWERGHLKLAGLYRQVRYKSLSTEGFDYFSGWGLVASGVIRATAGGDLLTYQLMSGAGVAGYMVGYSGLGLDAIPNLDGRLTAAPTYGGYLGYQHFWAPQWSSTAVAGYARIDNDALETIGDLSETAYGSVNLYWHPISRMNAGLEVLYGFNREPTQAEPIDGETGEGIRFQFVLEYHF